MPPLPAAAARSAVPARISGLLAAGLLLAGCDLSFRHDDGDTVVAGRGSARQAGGTGLGLEVAGNGAALSTRRDGEIRLRFTAPLDADAAREAIRVVDETRGDAPVPVVIDVRERDAVLRSPAAEGPDGGFRPGARLRIEVAGMPSLRALRAADGRVLPRTAVLHADVREGRREDRVAPRLVSSEPADGAEGVDPFLATVVLHFSEPLHHRSLGVRVTADGKAVRVRSVADRTGTTLTLVPAEGLPGGAAVLVELTGRIRDRSGNPLADDSPRVLGFTTGAGGPRGTGWILEPFLDGARMDPAGTTVPWGQPDRPGVLEGRLGPLVLEVAGEGEERPFRLDPIGGRFRVLVPAGVLGDEPRVLRGLHLVAAPGSAGGRVLDPVVRLAPATGDLPGDGETPPSWRTVAEEPGSLGPRGPEDAYVLPFRVPYRHDGAGDLLVEFSWSGVVGSVVLRGAGTGRPSMTVPWSPDPVPFTVDLRLEGTGERAVARSAWMDSGSDDPWWQEARVRPAADGEKVRILLQGAPPEAGAEGPDAARATPWTADPRDLEGMRWVRFRVEFPDPDPMAPAVVDDLAIPFVSR